MKLSLQALILVTSTMSNALVGTSAERSFSSVSSSALLSNDDETRIATSSADAVVPHVHVHPMPPNPEPYTVTSMDGTTISPLIQIIVRGEITSSPEIYEETIDGFTVKPVKGGKYTYLDVDDTTGELIETGLIAGKDDPVKSKLRKYAENTSRHIKRKKRLLSLQGNTTNARNLRDSNVELVELELELERRRRTAITSGTLKNLVIPFKFSDHTSRSLPSQAQLNTLMNNVGPDSSVCPTGSVRDVYLTNSFNQLDLQSTVIDWVTLDSTYTEAYCANGESGLSVRIHECLANALNKAVAAGVNFSDYDLDDSGEIDGMTFFHSGYAAEVGGSDSYGTSYSSRIWSHKWSLYSQYWTNNGVRVYEYHVNPALWSTFGSDIGRIGVIAHETGHFLGLPDLYDYGDGAGIGAYGLMANSWGFDWSQYYPPLMSAWGKKELGWVTPRIISTSGSYSLNQACDNADMIMIDAGYPSGEYLLIENRQACGTELVLPQGGLAIWHIDENANNVLGYNGQTGWPTNGDHYQVALLQADGSYDLEKDFNIGDSNDLFHSGGVNAIDPNGVSSGAQYPNTKAYQNGIIIDTEVKISNISAAGATMTFDITFGSSAGNPTPSPSSEPTSSPTKMVAVTPAPTFVFPRQGTVGPIECDQTVGGDTTNGENFYGNESPEYFYSFSLDAADRVTFSSCGSAFDTYIRIYSSNGVQLAYNDDFCGAQSVIAVSLEAGVYYVMMEGYSSYVGVYTMTMTCDSSPPTASPTKMVAVTPAPTGTPATIACNDSSLRLKIRRDNGEVITRFCSWAATRDTVNRCALDDIATACPATCGTCPVCADPTLRFKFPYNGNSIARSCEWVSRVGNKVNGRCTASDNICRSTCGKC